LRVTEPGKFTAEIDPEQMTWLRDDLARNKSRPSIIVTHAPVVSAVELFSDRARRTEDALAVPFGRVISNAPELVETAKQGNVRAFISGHLHPGRYRSGVNCGRRSGRNPHCAAQTRLWSAFSWPRVKEMLSDRIYRRFLAIQAF
jgi:3',5'-cyclic AMP phosphodiesterase CpdA